MDIMDFFKAFAPESNPASEVDKISLALGAEAEFLYIFFTSLQEAGFDYDEALTITVEFMKATFTNSSIS